VYLHVVGRIDQGLGDELDEWFHCFVFFSSDFTVGESWAPLLTQ
jgi:hypothetical protein